MSDAAPAWLAQQRATAPASLWQSMSAALAGSSVHDDAACAEGALRALRDAIRLGDDRAAALPLLTADALLTAACELAAGDADRLQQLAGQFAPAPLDAMLPDAAPPERE